MASVVDIFRSLLPPRTKSSPSGWTSFNAPCCHHRGHRADTKKRAGIRFDNNGVIYNCFNCKFSTGWQPGSVVGEKLKTLARWMGADEGTIKDLVIESLKSESTNAVVEQPTKIEFTEKPMPEGALPLKEWVDISKDLPQDLQEALVDVITYLVSRGYSSPIDNDFYWSPIPGYHDRVIIPFKWEGKIVGNTARKIKKGNPKYLSDHHPHFVFNFDNQHEGQKYILVTEGPFDAWAVDGVALLTNDVADQQKRIINSIGAEPIIIPDQDAAGLMLFDKAEELDWAVASPNWEDDVKDCADAVKRYGKLFVVVDAIMTAQRGPINIALAKRKLEHKLERLKHAENI